MAASFGPLKEGDRGAQVRELQQALVGLGLTDANGAPLEADSAFGPRTGEAVRAFQRAH
ncbi:peptidoglycan-binding domain-containing protein, partial [Staphylococcus gallinarum]|uniref:peptidoglycan-binding domain-containing protein n=1 Tax=Staphylococcus gallinarum TaxID=1293 RepID=UPI003CCC6372